MAIEIDKNFLESVLKEPVESFSIEAGSSAGDNVAGDLIAITVKTKNKQDIHLVHKTLPAPDAPNRQFAVDNKIFRTEAQFYSVAVPKIEQLINNRLQIVSSSIKKQTENENLTLGLRTVPSPSSYCGHYDSKYKIPVPKFYAAFNNDQNDYITLRDLRPEGYKMLDKFAGLDYDEVSLILKEISTFHAYSYFLIKHCGEKLFTDGEEFNHLNQNVWLVPEMVEFLQNMIAQMYPFTLKLVQNQDQRKLLENKISPSNCYKKVIETPLKTDCQLFPVLVHGDLWINNILFQYPQDATNDESENDPKIKPSSSSKWPKPKPTNVKFIDFQLARRGNIYEDLLYFIFTSTTPNFRGLHLNKVLNEYFDSFQSTLTTIDFPMPANLTRGSFMDGFYDGIFSTFITYSTFAIPMQLGDHSNSKEEEGNEAETIQPSSSSAEIKIENGSGSGLAEGPADDMVSRLQRFYSSSPSAVERLNNVVNELFELNVV